MLARTTYLVGGGAALVAGLSMLAPAAVWLTAVGLGLLVLATVVSVAVVPRAGGLSRAPLVRLQRD